MAVAVGVGVDVGEGVRAGVREEVGVRVEAGAEAVTADDGMRGEAQDASAATMRVKTRRPAVRRRLVLPIKVDLRTASA